MGEFLAENKIWIDVLTLLVAVSIGAFQISINNRLKKLQDYVAIIAVPDTVTNKIKLLNVGKINLYLWGFDMPGNKQKLNKPRLIAAGVGDSAYYWIDLPFIKPEHLQEDIYKFEFKLYLENEFGSRWISEHGGRADKVKIDREGREIDALEIKVWSYKIYKKEWLFQ